jgi:hypothetical protein
MIKSRLLGFCLIVFFLIQFPFVSVHAQTVGGMHSSDDFDGDGIINSIDLDDENGWGVGLFGSNMVLKSSNT